jgi:hypothetical protein
MIRISSMLAAGAFACAAMTPLTFASANDAATTELSAQREERQKSTTTRTTTRGGATVRTNQTTRPSGATVTTRSVDRRRGADVNVRRVERPSGATATKRTVTRPSGATSRTRTTVSPSGDRTRTTVTRAAPRQVTFSGERRRFEGARARAWSANRGTWVYGGRNYSYWRGGPYRVRYDNGWRTFVALSVLAPIAVGAATYYPYAYLSAPADICEGITEDGCQLTWTEVETIEGGTAPQCVSYCPWQ